MRSFPLWPTRLLLALAAGLPPAPSWAAIDWQLGRGTWTGGLGLSFNQSSQSSETDNSSASGSGRRLREFMRVQGSGLYVLDRRLINANLGLQLNLSQNSYTSSAAGTSSTDSSSTDQVLGYNFDASILEQKPYPITLYANRNQTESNQSFGGRTEGTSENRGFSLRLKEDSFLQNWGGPWFSAQLTARQEHQQATTTSFGRVSQTDQQFSTVDISADKGFTTSDLKFRYLANEQSSALLPANRSQTASLLYSLDFGPGLNHYSASSLSYTTNSGLVESNTLTAAESLSMAHNRNLSTNYNYGLTRNEAGDTVTLEQSGSFTLSHQLYENLSTSFNLDGTHLALPFGTLTSYGGQFSQSYTHSLPGSGALGLSWSAGYHHYNNDLSVGFVGLKGEPHVAPAELDPGFLLGKSFVLVSSIQVFNVQTGVRVLLAAVPAGGGAGDYKVVEEGNRVRIEPVYVYLGLAIDPNAPVKPGDKLEVDYTYQVDASLEYENRSAGYAVAVDYGWIGATYQHSQSTQQPLAGEARFLNSTRDDYASLHLRGAWRGYQTSATVSHARSISTNLKEQLQTDTTRLALQGSGRVLMMDGQANAIFDRYRADLLGYDLRLLSATLFWRPQYNWDMTFGASASNTHYLLPERQSSALSARAALNWNAEGGWINTAFAEARTRTDSTSARQTVLQLTARTRKRWGKLSLSAGVSFDYSVSGAAHANSQGFEVALMRSFW